MTAEQIAEATHLARAWRPQSGPEEVERPLLHLGVLGSHINVQSLPSVACCCAPTWIMRLTHVGCSARHINSTLASNTQGNP